MKAKGVGVFFCATALVFLAIVIYSVIDLRCTAPCNSLEHGIISKTSSTDDGFFHWLYNEGKLKLEPFILKVEIGLCGWVRVRVLGLIEWNIVRISDASVRVSQCRKAMKCI